MGEVSGEAIVPSDHALICKKEVVERFKDSVPVDQEVPPPFREGDEGHGYQGGTEQYQDPVAGREDPLVDQEKGQVTANHTSRQLEQDPVASDPTRDQSLLASQTMEEQIYLVDGDAKLEQEPGSSLDQSQGAVVNLPPKERRVGSEYDSLTKEELTSGWGKAAKEVREQKQTTARVTREALLNSIYENSGRTSSSLKLTKEVQEQVPITATEARLPDLPDTGEQSLDPVARLSANPSQEREELTLEKTADQSPVAPPDRSLDPVQPPTCLVPRLRVT
jgi:hypothetical protein